MRSVFLAVVMLALSPLVLAQDACESQRIASPSDIPPWVYGFSTATNGRFWFVGDRAARTRCGGDPMSCSTGAVHVYEMIDAELVHVQTIVPPDARIGDNFGASLDVEGDRLAVGAFVARWPDSRRGSGAVYMYEFDGEAWVESSRIAAPDEIDSGFGTNLDLNGQDMVVWPNQGANLVYTYRHEGDQWSLTGSLRPEPDARGWRFGYAMQLTDEWLFVGAPYDDTITASGGSVYVYRREPGGELRFVQREQSDSIARFGHALAFNGRTLLVGAPLASPEQEFQGAVRTYEFDGDRWISAESLTHSGAAADHALGVQISVAGTTLLAATSQELTPEGRGSVYEFSQDDQGRWHERRRLSPNPSDYVLHFGLAMGMADGHALVTSMGEPGGGAAYFFDLACNLCPADLDLDGALTIFDFLTFLNLFQDGDSLADFDGDGELTIFDFLAFQTAFDAGCE